jgi:hypothetical protein
MPPGLVQDRLNRPGSITDAQRECDVRMHGEPVSGARGGRGRPDGQVTLDQPVPVGRGRQAGLRLVEVGAYQSGHHPRFGAAR